MTVPRPLRILGWIVADLVAALVGSAVFEDEVGHIFRTHSLAALTHRALIRAAIVAFVLGYAAYCIRPHESAKWLWIAGFVLVGSRVAYLWFNFDSRILRRAGAGPSIFSEMAGQSLIRGDVSALDAWITYTLLPIRMTGYSVGALLASVSRDRAIAAWNKQVSRRDEKASDARDQQP